MKRIVLAVCLLAWPALASAQPSISGTSGTLTHGSSLTITGSSFGTKAVAAPTVWDNASGTTITTLWTGGWPSTASNSLYNLAYRTVTNGVAMPHSRISKYMTGAHGESGASGGDNVMAWKGRTGVTFPAYTYLSWYYRQDPSWTEAAVQPNNKRWEYGGTTEPYDCGTGYIYADVQPPGPPGDWGFNADCVVTGPANFGSTELANPASGWLKYEVVAKWTQGATTGSAVLTELKGGVGQQIGVQWSGNGSDSIGGTSRNDAFGGFERQVGTPNNRRYFADIYLDYTWSHVVLCDTSTYAACTVRETQIPTAWAATSITVTQNYGALSDGSTKYVYVMDSAGNVNSTGFTLSGGGGPSATPRFRLRQRGGLVASMPIACGFMMWRLMRRRRAQ